MRRHIVIVIVTSGLDSGVTTVKKASQLVKNIVEISVVGGSTRLEILTTLKKMVCSRKFISRFGIRMNILTRWTGLTTDRYRL